ncbi:unnamed protein product [Bemisia tabaci]|uniref:BLOC-1-related complex subunit 7 n=1 Tax=Bemisia tabaci TaxID=7038 RepID=A0A9P0A9E5_BEMTA|nr:PREDICTED: uncharacterized protein LOC109039329 [Bemisia tabaci]CAH0389423.1 unnamed protein product [Bemisia tabaci]
MASASSTSARSLFAESKSRLAAKIEINLCNIASVSRHILKGSRSSDILMGSAKSFAAMDGSIDAIESNLHKLQGIESNLRNQHQAIENSLHYVEEVKEQVRAMQR